MTVAATGLVLALRTSLTVVFVSVLARIASEKVTRTFAFDDTPVARDDGLTAVTRGRVVSTLHVREAGVGSSFPASSIARTSKV